MFHKYVLIIMIKMLYLSLLFHMVAANTLYRQIQQKCHTQSRRCSKKSVVILGQRMVLPLHLIVPMLNNRQRQPNAMLLDTLQVYIRKLPGISQRLHHVPKRELLLMPSGCCNKQKAVRTNFFAPIASQISGAKLLTLQLLLTL